MTASGNRSFLGGHFEVGIPMRDGLQQPALPRLPGQNGWATVAALADGFSGVDPQAPLGTSRLNRMAAIAVLDKDGPNSGFEKIDPFTGWGFFGFRVGSRLPDGKETAGQNT